MPAPLVQIRLIEQTFGGLCSVSDSDPAVPLAIGQDVHDGRAQRSQADTPGDDHNVTALCFCERPSAAVRPTHADAGAGLEPADCPGHGPNRPNGVNQHVGGGRITGDRKRDLTDSENVHHCELAGLKGEPRALGCLQCEGHCVAGFSLGREHQVRNRQCRLDNRRGDGGRRRHGLAS